MVEIIAADEQQPGSRQTRQLQESFLLQLVREDWISVEAVRHRLRQLKLEPLAAEGLRLRYAAAELKLPQETLSSLQKHRQAELALFQRVCRETVGGWKQIYPFGDETNPQLVYFLIPAKDGAEQSNRATRFTEELAQRIGQNSKLEYTVTAGSEVKGLKRLRNAFVSCQCELETGAVPIPEEWVENGVSLLTSWYSPEAEHRLVQIIKDGNTSAYQRELDLLESGVGHSETPPGTTLYKALRLLLLLAITAGKFECSGTALSKYLWNSRRTLAASASSAQLRQQLNELGQLVMEEVRLAYQAPGRVLAEAVRKYAERNYGCELTLSAAAGLFDIAEGELSRQFKQHVGIPLSDYITKIRMARAEQLLQDDSLKLTDLALLAGYSSPSHFVAAFKKYSGVSPKDYRARLQKSR